MGSFRVWVGSVDLPGHKKHTKATRTICDSGDAYHENLKGPSLGRLYIQPEGRSMDPASTDCVAEPTCSVGVAFSMSPSAMVVVSRELLGA